MSHVGRSLESCYRKGIPRNQFPGNSLPCHCSLRPSKRLIFPCHPGNSFRQDSERILLQQCCRTHQDNSPSHVLLLECSSHPYTWAMQNCSGHNRHLYKLGYRFPLENTPRQYRLEFAQHHFDCSFRPHILVLLHLLESSSPNNILVL